MSHRLHVVIVHRDQPDKCARTVEAFARQGLDLSITVVDNSSSPDSPPRLHQLLAPGTQVVAAGTNAGFGPGANIGLRRWLEHGDSEWVAVAPHDARPGPGCLTRMLDAVASRPDAGLVCAEFGPGLEFVPAVDWVIGGYYRPSARGVGWQDVPYPHGTLMLARRATLQEIGLFDERYFAYCEEVDLGLRATRRGWRVGLVWGAVVTNGRLPTQLLADYLQVRNTLLLVRSHFGRYPAAVRAVLAVFAVMGRVWRDPRQSLTHVRVEGQAVADFARGRFGAPPPAVLALAQARSAA